MAHSKGIKKLATIVIDQQGGLWCATLRSKNNKAKTLLFGIHWEAFIGRNTQKGISGAPMVDCCCEQHANDVSKTLHSAVVTNALFYFNPRMPN